MAGFLNLDKPAGKSSAHAVNAVKRVTKSPCGHMGTLDPFATGVLPVGIGNATRLFDYLLTKKKRYLACFLFGATTDTLDSEGTLQEGGEVPREEEIEGALPAFRGTFMQVPPVYSAKSVGGRRSYQLARTGRAQSLEGRTVTVYAFDLLHKVSENEFEFSIECGAGTYIRALARDLAASLGTLGYCSALRRTASGIFTEETAVSLSALTAENWREFLIPTDTVLDLPAFESGDGRLLQGQKIPCDLPDGLYKFYFDGAFYGLARAADGTVKAEKKLC